MTHMLRSLVTGGLIALGGLPPAGAQTSQSDCSREALRGLVDQYFAALAAHDPSGLPLAPNVRSTENGVEVAVGKGLWQTAGKALLRRVLVDTRQCGAHASAVLEEPFTSAAVGPANAFSGKKPLPAEGTVRPILFGVRLRVEGGGSPRSSRSSPARGSSRSTRKGSLATKDQDWESLLPPEERSSRLAMVAAADDYFGMFAAAPEVRTPFASPCDRWENGMFATAGGTALPGEDGKAAQMRAHDCSPKGLVISNHGPRRFLVDVEAGLVVAFVHFAGSLPDFHVFKMRNGRSNASMPSSAPGRRRWAGRRSRSASRAVRGGFVISTSSVQSRSSAPSPATTWRVKVVAVVPPRGSQFVSSVSLHQGRSP